MINHEERQLNKVQIDYEETPSNITIVHKFKLLTDRDKFQFLERYDPEKS